MSRNYSNVVATNITTSSTMSVAATSIDVSSGTTFPSADFTIAIDDEVMLVTGLSGASSTDLTVERGFDGTTAATHASGASVNHVVVAADMERIWVAGSGPSYVTDPADKPPNTANAKDDEFTGTTLDAKWTWANQGTATASVDDGKLTMNVNENYTGLRVLYQSVPSGSWTATAKIRPSINNSAYSGCFLLAALSTTTDYRGAGTWAHGRNDWIGVTQTAFTAATAVWNSYQPNNTGMVPAYFKLDWNGTTLTGYASTDAYVWDTVGTWTPGSAPTIFGFGINNQTNASRDQSIEWFRVDWTPDYDPAYDGGGTSFSGAKISETGTNTNIAVDTWTDVGFTASATVAYNTDSYWDSTSPLRFTIPADGKYLLNGWVLWSEDAKSGDRLLQFYLNDTAHIDGDSRIEASSVWQTGQERTVIADLSADDYVEMRVLQSGTGGSLPDIDDAVFSIARLHSSGAVKIDDLTDVDTSTTAPVAGDLLLYDGTDWVPYQGGQIQVQPGGTYDDEFDDDSIHANWTAVTPTGTATWTEGHHRLSVIASGNTTGDICAQLKAFTGSAPTTIETAMRFWGSTSNYPMGGLVFADGATASSNAVGLSVYRGTATADSLTVEVRSGTLTALTTGAGAVGDATATTGMLASDLFLRLVWSATNTFTVSLSIDGVTWTDFGYGNQTPTLTPTHAGVFATAYGSSDDALASFEYFRLS